MVLVVALLFGIFSIAAVLFGKLLGFSFVLKSCKLIYPALNKLRSLVCLSCVSS